MVAGIIVSWLGPKFSTEHFAKFREPVPEILQLTAAKLSNFQIPWLATASHLWLKTVKKLQLLKAGIVLKADMH